LHLSVGQTGLGLAHPSLCRRDVFGTRFLFELRQACPGRFQGRALDPQVSLQVAVVDQEELLSGLDTLACFHKHLCD
jgi:hypothetical protein